MRETVCLLPAVFSGADTEEFPEGFREIADIFKAAGISRFQNGQIGLRQKLRAPAQPERVQVSDGGLMQIALEKFAAAAPAQMPRVGDVLQINFL